MSKLSLSITMSLDGYVAGPDQSEEDPLGIGGMELHEWFFPLKAFREMHGEEGGEVNASSGVVQERRANIGATIMGRNMFGPQRGPWPNEDWKGWWGPNPPYHHPVFVLSHHKHSSFEMEGGTSFSFVNDGIESALKQAFAAAKGKDVRIGGGASTVSQYLKAALVDELHFVLVPMLMGSGERIFEGLDGLSDSYEVAEYIPSKTVAHVCIVKKAN
jgi:dihydrofolate reductase